MSSFNEIVTRSKAELANYAEQQSFTSKEPVAYLTGNRTFNQDAWCHRKVKDAEITKLPVYQMMNDNDFIILERPDVFDGEHIEAIIFDNNGIGWGHSVDSTLPEEGFMSATYSLPTTDGLPGFRPDEALSGLFAARGLISASTKFSEKEKQVLLHELDTYLDGVWHFIKRILIADIDDDYLNEGMDQVLRTLDDIHPKIW